MLAALVILKVLANFPLLEEKLTDVGFVVKALN
jgi:hypothetical protein